MFLFKRIKIRTHEMGLHFRDGEFQGLLRAGQHWLADDLEGYVDEGVLVFEAGQELPMPALLTA